MQRWIGKAAGAWLAMAMGGAAQAAPCAGFNDVDDTDPFCASITWMKNQAITLGCGDGTNYCPADLVRRDQMAAFLYRMRNVAFLQGGNAFGATAVLGTTDNQALDLRANGSRVLRLEPNSISPNVIEGSPSNAVPAGLRGASIGGGGTALGDVDPDFSGEGPNRVTDAYGTIGGGMNNLVGDDTGTAVDQPFATVGGGTRNWARGAESTIGGGSGNRANGTKGTVGGGMNNVADALASVVGGGLGNQANGTFATVSGGIANKANADWSMVGGGVENLADGWASVIGGGEENIASGRDSAVPGGYRNVATGDYSFAAGVGAKAIHHRSFVWGGDLAHDVGSQADGDFGVYAPSRIRLYAAAFSTGGCEFGVGNVGGNLTCAGVITAASFVPPSDRALKEAIVPVDPSGVLARVVAMPIAEWSYAATPGVRHMGPMG